MTIDPARLARAVWLDVEPLPGDRWMVTGGRMAHLVAGVPSGLLCDCSDAAIGRQCKHQLAVRLYAGDGETIKALRALVPRPRQRQVAA